MVFISNFFNKIKRFLRAHGFLITFKSILWELGILGLNNILKLIRLKIYSTIKYPMTNIKIYARFNNFFWKKVAAGLWEVDCIRYLSKIVKKGQTILDVGANIGPYTLLLSKLIGNEGKVIAFEPDSSAYKILIENVELNKLNNVISERMGLSNFVGTSKLVIYRNIFGGRSQSISSLNLRNNELKFKYEPIKITTIDKYCEENDIKPDGIIIDVEGAEGLVTEGAQKVINQYSPWILLEFHGNLMSEEENIVNLQKILKSSKKVAIVNDRIQFYDTETVKHISANSKFNLFLKD